MALQVDLTAMDANEKNNHPQEILAMPTMVTSDKAINPLSMKATTDNNTMYMHEAIRKPDKEMFIEAMEKEIRDQMENDNFTIVHKEKFRKIQ